MISLLLLAAAAPVTNESRTIIEAQLASPPRSGHLSPAEVAAIEQRYLASIGKRIERDKNTESNSGQ